MSIKKNTNSRDIDKNNPMAYYPGIYGKGEEAKMYFAFKFIPILAIMTFGVALAILFGLPVIGKLIGTPIDPLPVFGAAVPFFSAPLTFMLGYLFGDKRKN